MVIAKRLRDERRKEKAIVSDNEQREMIRESQYMKAELHRTKKRYAALLEVAEAEVEAYNSRIAKLKISVSLNRTSFSVGFSRNLLS